MITTRPCVNGILAAVLSASIIPIHGALAKEKAAPLKHAVKQPAKHARPTPPKSDAGKSDAGKGDAAKPDMGAPADGAVQ